MKTFVSRAQTVCSCKLAQARVSSRFSSQGTAWSLGSKDAFHLRGTRKKHGKFKTSCKLTQANVRNTSASYTLWPCKDYIRKGLRKRQQLPQALFESLKVLQLLPFSERRAADELLESVRRRALEATSMFTFAAVSECRAASGV